MPTKLSIYQGAAAALGDRKIVSLTENRTTRRELDGAWDRGAVRTCLSFGIWNFALRVVQLDYSASVAPDFGYQRAFDKPSDAVRTGVVSQDGHFISKTLQYSDEASFWFADQEVLYVKYVSDDVNFGMDLGNWPENFTRMVEHYLALQVVDRVTQSENKKAVLEKDFKFWKSQALNTDALDEPTSFAPRGSWVTARGWGWGRRDGGSRTRLLG